jgi:hypothetical protein
VKKDWGELKFVERFVSVFAQSRCQSMATRLVFARVFFSNYSPKVLKTQKFADVSWRLFCRTCFSLIK